MYLLAWNWSIFFYDIGIEIGGSLFFVYMLLLVFRPWVKISPFICRNQSEFHGEGMMYFFKVVNCSLYTAYEIEAELNVLEERPTPPSGMRNKRMIPLTLVYETFSHLPAFRPKFWRKDAAHCIRFRTKEDITNILKDNTKSIQIQITLRHGLTGLVKVYKKEYSDLQQVKDGKFSYGSKFGVI